MQNKRLNNCVLELLRYELLKFIAKFLIVNIVHKEIQSKKSVETILINQLLIIKTVEIEM